MKVSSINKNKEMAFMYLLFLALCTNLKIIEAKKPHVIIIVADDLGWNDVSFHGSDQIPTPHIDRLASQGIVLNNYYTLPICTPSRAALLTGKYPIHTGMQSSVIFAPERWGLGLNETLFPQYLKKQGYKTHAIGKWHLGYYAKEFTPTHRGFDSHYGHYLGWNDYWDHHVQLHYKGLDLHHNERPVWNQKGNYSVEMYTSEAESRISNHDPSDPLFLYVAFNAVHSAMPDDPLQAPKEWIDRFKHIKDMRRRIFAAVVGYMDYGVGRIHDALLKKGMLNNSIILFTTDNGAAPNGFNRNWGSNYPLRGTKASLFEGGVRGSAFIYSKLLKHPGIVSHDLIHITDWLPTFVNLAGHEDVSQQLDGYDIWETLQSREPSPRREILLNIDPVYFKNLALRWGKWKIVKDWGYCGKYWNGWYPPPGATNEETQVDQDVNSSSSTILDAEVKCGGPVPQIYAKCRKKFCLFDLENDPCEFHDVSEKFSHILEAMKLRMEMYKKGMVPPLLNRTTDPLSNPALRDGVWEPWVTL